MARRIKKPTIQALALVKRGANRVNVSSLKSEVKGIIFKEESVEDVKARQDFVDIEDVKPVAIILDEIADIYKECKDEKTQTQLEELLTSYNEKVPNVEKAKSSLTTAEDFLKGV